MSESLLLHLFVAIKFYVVTQKIHAQSINDQRLFVLCACLTWCIKFKFVIFYEPHPLGNGILNYLLVYICYIVYSDSLASLSVDKLFGLLSYANRICSSFFNTSIIVNPSCVTPQTRIVLAPNAMKVAAGSVYCHQKSHLI